MSDAITSAGTRIYVADAVIPNPYNVAGFEGLTWVEVGEVTDLGEFGRVYNQVTHNPLADRRTVKRKGSYDDGNVTMQLALVTGDAGQVILDEALDDDNSFPFRVVFQDGAVRYFAAQVMSFPINVGGVDQILSASVQLGIDNDILTATSVST